MTEPKPNFVIGYSYSPNHSFGKELILTEVDSNITFLDINLRDQSITYSYLYQSTTDTIKDFFDNFQNIPRPRNFSSTTKTIDISTVDNWIRLDLTIDSSHTKITDSEESIVYSFKCVPPYTTSVDLHFGFDRGIDLILPTTNCNTILNFPSEKTAAVAYNNKIYVWDTDEFSLSNLTIVWQKNYDNLKFTSSSSDKELQLFGIKNEIQVPSIAFKFPEPTTQNFIHIADCCDIDFKQLKHDAFKYAREPHIFMTTDGFVAANRGNDRCANPFTGQYNYGWRIRPGVHAISRSQLEGATKVKLFAFNGQTPIPGVVEIPVERLFK